MQGGVHGVPRGAKGVHGGARGCTGVHGGGAGRGGARLVEGVSLHEEGAQPRHVGRAPAQFDARRIHHLWLQEEGARRADLSRRAEAMGRWGGGAVGR